MVLATRLLTNAALVLHPCAFAPFFYAALYISLDILIDSGVQHRAVARVFHLVLAFAIVTEDLAQLRKYLKQGRAPLLLR